MKSPAEASVTSTLPFLGADTTLKHISSPSGSAALKYLISEQFLSVLRFCAVVSGARFIPSSMLTLHLIPVAGSPPSQVNVKKSVEVVLKVGTYLRRSRFFSEMLCPSATSRPESLRTPFFGDGREVIVIYSNPPLPPTAFLKSSDVKDMSQFITPHFLISSLFFIITRPGERL